MEGLNEDNSQSNDAGASLDASNAESHNGSVEESSNDAINTEDSQKSNFENSEKSEDTEKKGINLKIFAKGGKGNFIRLEKKDEDDCKFVLDLSHFRSFGILNSIKLGISRSNPTFST